ncbi:LPS export ABC transporter periplasmic protein LptC [Variovorax sp. HJSM1_2]|uniref:LPS export ABC transporter periplasmic protein LptC n=1 Tax=Variovorax sp. HJSM1_2 TaxID=3366263 RepID=UPI003BE6C32F
MKTLVRAALDRVSIYLPIILMAMMALGTYWLVRNTPSQQQDNPEAQLVHEPDYFMRKFSVKTYDVTGRLKSELRGIEARHYPDTDTIEIDQAHIRSISPEGLVTISTANRALSNADASEVQLFGNAIVVREAGKTPSGGVSPRLEFRGEFLHAFINTEQVRSHKPVTLIRGSDQFTGDAMDYDNLDHLLKLDGRVRGVLNPRPTAQAK